MTRTHHAVAAKFAELGCAALQDAAPQYCLVFNPAPVIRVLGKLAAPIFPVITPNDMLPCLQALDMAPAGYAIFIRNSAVESHALVGDIFATAASAKGLAGVVVEGAVRDLDGLREIGLPVLSTEVTFVSAKTAVCKAVSLPHTIEIDDYRPAFQQFQPGAKAALECGDWIFADSDGVLAVKQQHVRAVIAAASILNERELQLKAQLMKGEAMSAIIGLQDFLHDRGQLKFTV